MRSAPELEGGSKAKLDLRILFEEELTLGLCTGSVLVASCDPVVEYADGSDAVWQASQWQGTYSCLPQ